MKATLKPQMRITILLIRVRCPQRITWQDYR
nr:MAG TPA: hypothetical protein [Caudoviricetes sp.]